MAGVQLCWTEATQGDGPEQFSATPALPLEPSLQLPQCGVNMFESRAISEEGAPRKRINARVIFRAERAGFEPAVALTTPDFESGTFGLSVTSPLTNLANVMLRVKWGW